MNPPGGDGPAVLIVDDNQLNLKLVRVVLEMEGYHVRTAADGEEMHVVLRTFRPDLILMDIQLPGMDGLELTRRLKKDESTRGIPVVAITAYAMKGDKEKAAAAGCDGYLPKPLDVGTLPSVIGGYLKSSGQPDNQIN